MVNGKRQQVAEWKLAHWDNQIGFWMIGDTQYALNLIEVINEAPIKPTEFKKCQHKNITDEYMGYFAGFLRTCDDCGDVVV